MTKSPRAVAQEALRLAQEALPAYSSKYSRKDFTQHQLFAVLALKTFLKTDYRGVVTFLGGLLFGYDQGVISGALPLLTEQLGLTTFESEGITSICVARYVPETKGRSLEEIQADWTRAGTDAEPTTA